MGNNTSIATIESSIKSFEVDFSEISKLHGEVIFKKESSFALQQLTKNNFLMTTAMNNPTSLKFAIMNVANIGVSLCPAKKQAYLIPRNREVVLDISYIGLCFLAQETGVIEWIQSKIVHENDTYEFNGVGEMPTHKYNSFGDRGAMVGVYCVAYTGKSYLVEEMPIVDVFRIRSRSEGYKAYIAKKIKSCPWVTDETEMIKKTVVKRAFKMWPKSEKAQRLSTAIDVINKHEGINFDEEKIIELASDEQIIEIKKLLEILKRDENSFCNYFSRVAKKDITLETINHIDAALAITQLSDIHEREVNKNKKEETNETCEPNFTADDINL